MVVVLNTCDSNSFYWDSFIHYFEKYWTNKCDKYFCNEELNVEYDGFIQLKSGKGEWSNRLINTLRKISDDYVFYIQENHWLKQSVSPGLINSLIYLMKNKDIQCVYLSYKDNNYTLIDSKLEFNLKSFHPNSLNLLNRQPAIWNKNFLIQSLKENESSFDNEKKGTERLWKKNLVNKIMLYQINWYTDVVKDNSITLSGKLLVV